jgi:hypothetical protein
MFHVQLFTFSFLAAAAMLLFADDSGRVDDSQTNSMLFD